MQADNPFKREPTLDGLDPIEAMKQRSVAALSFVHVGSNEVLRTFYFDQPGLAIIPPLGSFVTIDNDKHFNVRQVHGYYPDPHNPNRILFVAIVAPAAVQTSP